MLINTVKIVNLIKIINLFLIQLLKPEHSHYSSVFLITFQNTVDSYARDVAVHVCHVQSLCCVHVRALRVHVHTQARV